MFGFPYADRKQVVRLDPRHMELAPARGYAQPGPRHAVGWSGVTDFPDLPPMATPRVAAGALFVDDAGRVLLVRPTYKRHWDLPGGYLEPGESPLAACSREVQEELGLTVSVGQMLVVDWAPAEAEGDKLLFIFDGGTLAANQLADIRLQEDELVDYAFYDLAAASDLLIPRLARRLAEALTARLEGKPRYLEHGTVQPL